MLLLKADHNFQNKFLLIIPVLEPSSVTRFGDLFDFGQLFKAFDNN